MMNYGQVYQGMGGPTNANGYGSARPTPNTGLNLQTNAGVSVNSAGPLVGVCIAVAAGLALLYWGTLKIQGSRG